MITKKLLKYFFLYIYFLIKKKYGNIKFFYFLKVLYNMKEKSFFSFFSSLKVCAIFHFGQFLKCEKSKIKNTFIKKKHETGTVFLVPFFQLLRSSITNILLLIYFYLHLAYSILRISNFLTFYNNTFFYN